MRAGPQLRERPRSGDEGTTLVELLVVMALTTVILAAVGTVFVAATRSIRSTQVHTYAQADARTAAEAMSRSLRVAVTPPGASATSPFDTATPTSVTFYANLQRTAVTYATSGPTAAPVIRAGLQLPSRVAYAYDSSTQCITETVTLGEVNTTATASTAPVLWTTPGTPKCLARTTVAPSFSYFTSSVIESGGATTAPLPLTSGALAASAAQTVTSVGFELTVTSPTAQDVPGTTISDRVTLINVVPSQVS